MKRNYFVSIGIVLLCVAVVGGMSFSKRPPRDTQEAHVDTPTFLDNALSTITPSKVDTDVSYIPPVSSLHMNIRDHSWIATLSGDRVRTLVATGDVIPARAVNVETIKHNDFTWGWRNIATLLRQADLSLINLEAPLIIGCPQVTSGFQFCGDTRHIEGLVHAGVDVANLANNHAGNYGISGLIGTKSLLSTAKIDVVGMGMPVIRDIDGIRFGFLGYNDIGGGIEGIASASAAYISRDIREIRSRADIVVVSFHWGVEYEATPSARQVQLAHAAIDEGADLIIGNHPHWVQSAEVYKGKWITYAHGNTIFDQMWSDETRIGVIGTYVFYDTAFIDVSFTPIKIDNYGQPRLAPELQTFVENRLLGK